MFRSGLLVLTSSLLYEHNLPAVVKASSTAIRNLLYVHLISDKSAVTVPDEPLVVQVPFTHAIRSYITRFYTEAARVSQSLEVRFLVGNISNLPLQALPPQTLEKQYEVVLTDLKSTQHNKLTEYLRHQFPVQSPFVIKQFEDIDRVDVDGTRNESVKTYKSVCLGGAFDQIHVGHRILLTEACLLSTERVVIGVAQGRLIAKKVLNELMNDVHNRVDNVRRLVNDIKPSLQYQIVPIDDVYGPAGTDGSIECIVVSQETTGGAKAINVRRLEQGMNSLTVETIELVPDVQRAVDEEEKVSSSSLRRRLLGNLLRPPLKKTSRPYLIGLTGGTASGKSAICKRLEGLGAGIISCDLLGHRSYEPGTTTYSQLVSAFGEDVVGEDGQINRRQLAARVFGNKVEMDRLNSIVWPAIRQLCKQEIDQLNSQGYSVIVLDAAVLLEAGWDDMVHEIWTTVVPVDEAIKRLANRNGLVEEEARRRIASQMTNEQRVARANVVLCTLWHPDVTQQQVEKAWSLLQERIVES